MPELHRLEKELLLAFEKDKRLSIGEIKKKSGLSEDSIRRAAMWLSSKKMVKIKEERRYFVQLDSEGRKFFREGLPERRLVEAIIKREGRILLENISDVTGLNEEEITIAIGWAKKKKWIRIIKEKEKTILETEKEPSIGFDEELIKFLAEGKKSLNEIPKKLERGLNLLKKRPHAIILTEEVRSFISLTKKGHKALQTIKQVMIPEISQLTPDLISSGKWREVKFRKYDIAAPALNVWPGKKQPYKRFLDELKWKLVTLGFKEMHGPIVEVMFFNCDALFMPQDHPAREIFDIYFVKTPTYGILKDYKSIINNVKASHENGWKTGSKGWRYKFSTQETKRLILRSHGTALSVRTLMSKDLEIPGKYFSIVRCYRPDVVDRTHLTEFNQVEGIVVAEDLTFRDLLGVLEKFAIEIAKADKVRFRPDYFPFTEPSVELAAYKKGYGWLEFGGAGIFRPELTLPLGVSAPVIAWGLGVDRLFMMKTGINDIRYLFTKDLEWLRKQRLT